MDLIRSFCEKLRALAVTLDVETARLQRALDGEDSDFEGYPVRILHDLHSEVRTLKDDVSTLLDKASLESKESIVFIKATKVLMKKNSEDITKIREFFQKYGYDPQARKNSVGEEEVVDSTLESTSDEHLEQPGVQGGVSDVAVLPASEKPPCSPQLSDFGLERYLISQVPPNPPPVETDRKEELDLFTPSSQQSLIKGLKTPKCALNMDDFACVTPKLEHVGIPEYTMCFNDDYTVGLKNVKKKSKEAGEAEPVSRGHSCATPGLTHQQLEKNDAEYTESPMAPTFCTPGLKIPFTKNSTALVSTDCSASNTNSSSNNLEMKDCTSLILNSDKCFENFMAPPSPVISSYENLLRTPTPPKVTTIPEDILQILSKYNPNLATPVAIKAAPPSRAFLPEGEGQRIRAAAAPNCYMDSGGSALYGN